MEETQIETVMVASDAPSVRAEIRAAIEGPKLNVVEASSGEAALSAIRKSPVMPDLLIVDMQMGNMGAIAVSYELSLEESYADVLHLPVLVLLDRRPDVLLAKRARVEGWLIKPLDPLRLRRATRDLLAGGRYEDTQYMPSPVLVT